MSNIHAETLKAICSEILEANGGMNEDLLTRIETLYEEALLANYLQLRQDKLSKIHSSVQQRAAEVPTPEAPKPAPAPVRETPSQLETPAASRFGDEVKVLPHPEGPPAPAREPEPEVVPEPAPVQNVEELISPTPTPPPANAGTEELRRVLEERTVPPKPATTPPPAQASSGSRLNNLNIGLNDRIAFVKQLFMGSQEDYQRVISQINTMDEYGETIDFIENVVKPDYDWSQVEETEQRLLDLVANRFNR